MTRDVWTAVDRYFGDLLLERDDVLDAAQRASDEAGLPAIQVSPAQGRFLQMLAGLAGARRILEVGTLGGYSTIWLARALGPGGRLVTLEVNPAHAEVATANIDRAGLADVVEVRVGRALDTLPRLAEEDAGPFDLAFIDADKASNADYFTWAVRLARPGAVIVVDNVVRGGAVLEPVSDDPSVQGTRRLAEVVGAEKRVTATVLQTVGSKGHDGFLVARVVD